MLAPELEARIVDIERRLAALEAEDRAQQATFRATILEAARVQGQQLTALTDLLDAVGRQLLPICWTPLAANRPKYL